MASPPAKNLSGTDALLTSDRADPIAGYVTDLVWQGVPPTVLAFS
jgi:hypothetical protein